MSTACCLSAMTESGAASMTRRTQRISPAAPTAWRGTRRLWDMTAGWSFFATGRKRIWPFPSGSGYRTEPDLKPTDKANVLQHSGVTALVLLLPLPEPVLQAAKAFPSPLRSSTFSEQSSAFWFSGSPSSSRSPHSTAQSSVNTFQYNSMLFKILGISSPIISLNGGLFYDTVLLVEARLMQSMFLRRFFHDSGSRRRQEGREGYL